MTITTPLKDPNSSLVEGWTALWNGDLSQAATICAEQVTVHFGGRAIAEAGDHVMDASALPTSSAPPDRRDLGSRIG
jgi:hypothetical protein